MKIYVLMAFTDYEGGECAGVFTTEEKAQEAKKKHEKDNQEYHDDQIFTDYETKLKYPRFNMDGFVIREFVADEI